ncbi:hypothetical protein BDZ89DRAFT_1069775 [Hymenopellis radicata]|nr:hypothetical protein BDZ89DRAFT_1069775 [Hymenopellis radicata]
MRSINVSFVLLALAVASQAAPLDEGVSARQEGTPDEGNGDESNLMPPHSAWNTDDTPSPTRVRTKIAQQPTYTNPLYGPNWPILRYPWNDNTVPAGVHDIKFIKKDTLGVSARQEGNPDEGNGDEGNFMPKFTSPQNTDDTGPSPTRVRTNIAQQPTSTNHSDSQPGCHCPPFSWKSSTVPLGVLPRCKCRSPSGSAEPPMITRAVVDRDLEARKGLFGGKLIWDGLKWVFEHVGEAGGDDDSDPTIKTADTPKTMIDDSQLGAGSGNASAS